MLRGGDGSDVLSGDGSGRSSNHTLTGGAGRDIFRFSPSDAASISVDLEGPFVGGGRDLITDFVRGTDKVALSVGADYSLVDGPSFLEVRDGRDVDQNGDSRITAADGPTTSTEGVRLDVLQQNVTFDGVTKASLVLSIGGHDTLSFDGVTQLGYGDFQT